MRLRLQHCALPPGSPVLEDRKEGSVVVCPYPCLKSKVTTHANSQESPVSQARETDGSLCVHVLHPPPLWTRWLAKKVGDAYRTAICPSCNNKLLK